ncbi:hypothetical protein FB45DRAFT_867875 [Roridomyces roridus]|uniref:Uncharacterized protein n=1 Tax=Roridomyces roridus TaxID=1738132 RepID=A0AAD7BRV3_9AGAR|nr:hypothetical protein FB45DRAFT_867875 [Roridomyces roridus]
MVPEILAAPIEVPVLVEVPWVYRIKLIPALICAPARDQLEKLLLQRDVPADVNDYAKLRNIGAIPGLPVIQNAEICQLCKFASPPRRWRITEAPAQTRRRHRPDYQGPIQTFFFLHLFLALSGCQSLGQARASRSLRAAVLSSRRGHGTQRRSTCSTTFKGLLASPSPAVQGDKPGCSIADGSHIGRCREVLRHYEQSQKGLTVGIIGPEDGPLDEVD